MRRRLPSRGSIGSWDRSQGQVMAGLDNRRRCEWNVLKRIYELVT
jgi:hypothetical protein